MLAAGRENTRHEEAWGLSISVSGIRWFGRGFKAVGLYSESDGARKRG